MQIRMGHQKVSEFYLSPNNIIQSWILNIFIPKKKKKLFKIIVCLPVVVIYLSQSCFCLIIFLVSLFSFQVFWTQNVFYTLIANETPIEFSFVIEKCVSTTKKPNKQKILKIYKIGLTKFQTFGQLGQNTICEHTTYIKRQML